jgi:hypothetical protein
MWCAARCCMPACAPSPDLRHVSPRVSRALVARRPLHANRACRTSTTVHVDHRTSITAHIDHRMSTTAVERCPSRRHAWPATATADESQVSAAASGGLIARSRVRQDSFP